MKSHVIPEVAAHVATPIPPSVGGLRQDDFFLAINWNALEDYSHFSNTSSTSNHSSISSQAADR